MEIVTLNFLGDFGFPLSSMFPSIDLDPLDESTIDHCPLDISVLYLHHMHYVALYSSEDGQKFPITPLILYTTPSTVIILSNKDIRFLEDGQSMITIA